MLFVELPEHSIGLDLTPGDLVRPRAITVADVDDIELVDGSCDYVWAPPLPRASSQRLPAEIERVLRPGALAFVEEPAPSFPLLREVDLYGRGLRSLVHRLVVAARRLRLIRRFAPVPYRVFRRPPYPAPASRRRPLALYVIPAQSFWLLDILRTRETIQTLGRIGLDTAVVDVNAIRDAEAAATRAAIAAKPDLITAINLNYYLGARVGADDVLGALDVPATLAWDDPLGALTGYLNWERQSTMGDLGPRGVDPLPRFRELLRAPGTRHFAADSGHMAAMLELGLVEAAQVTWHPFPTFPAFLEQGRRGGVEPKYDLSFGGNVYQAYAASSAFSSMADYAEITDRVRTGKLRDLGASVWELLQAELEALGSARRAALGLVPTDTLFWDYYMYLAWFATTTAVRLELLTSVPRPVHMFGMFADPASVELLATHPNLVYSGNRHQFRELPETLAATRINLCVSQSLIFKGLPSKFLDCIAAGGFALVDHKDDLVRLFGPVVENVMFRTGDELNAKIEYFLPRDDERRELVEELRTTVERECALDRALTRIYGAYL
jgi:hypothetical protein